MRTSNPLAPSDSPAIVPRYFTAQDHPWLDSLLSEYERFVGRRRVELDQHLEAPLSLAVEPRKLKLARRVLDRLYGDRTEAAIAPRQLRGVAFRARALEPTRERALGSAARELHVAPESLEEWLFADLPGQRRLVALAAPLSSADLALEMNHALIRALLERAVLVNIYAEGDVRALVRAVKLRGLLCAARPEAGQRRLRLEISGPLALFRRTLVYGRALASLLPRVARCDRFELTAFCSMRGGAELRQLTLRSGDPIVAADAHSRYDSGVEERFARDFLRLTDDWDLIREPDAVPVAGHFVFPDFLIRHRRIQGCEAWLEIVGFWTPEYLADKLSRLREARLARFILCVDEQRNCADESLPAGALVVRYRRHVPAAEVLRELAHLWP